GAAKPRRHPNLGRAETHKFVRFGVPLPRNPADQDVLEQRPGGAMPAGDTPSPCRGLLARHDEARAADRAVVGKGAGAEAGPDVPAVTPRCQAEAVLGPLPALRQSELVRRRPRGEDALRAADELHVVVTGAVEASPA